MELIAGDYSLPLVYEAMDGFGGLSDLDIEAAFLTSAGKKTPAVQTDIQTLFIEFIGRFLRVRKHSPGLLHIFINISLLRNITDQTKLTFAHLFPLGITRTGPVLLDLHGIT